MACPFFSSKNSSTISGVLGGWLLDKIGMRRIGLLGATSGLVGLTVAAFSPNIYVLMVGFGLISGMCSRNMVCMKAWHFTEKAPDSVILTRKTGTIIAMLACVFPFSGMAFAFVFVSTITSLSLYWNKRKNLASGKTFVVPNNMKCIFPTLEVYHFLFAIFIRCL